MSQLTDLAEKENIDLENCIIFTKDSGDFLAVNIKYIGIKQRPDRLMSVNFSMSPKQVKQLDEFFSVFNSGELFYYDISQTGAIPVNYRGLSNVTKKVSNDIDSIFEVSLIMQAASNVAQENYLEPTCSCCSLKHIL